MIFEYSKTNNRQKWEEKLFFLNTRDSLKKMSKEEE